MGIGPADPRRGGSAIGLVLALAAGVVGVAVVVTRDQGPLGKAYEDSTNPTDLNVWFDAGQGATAAYGPFGELWNWATPCASWSHADDLSGCAGFLTGLDLEDPVAYAANFDGAFCGSEGNWFDKVAGPPEPGDGMRADFRTAVMQQVALRP